ncbi:cytochrome P450 [Streptomyces sp. YS-3]|uniref:cytochrome P450 n=1 Tax=Streptomyces sp. YS-3 TaxID=3381352 RepID=UPI0038625E2E
MTQRRFGLDQLGPLPTFMENSTEAVTPFEAPSGDMVWLVRGYELGRLVLADKRFSRIEAVKDHSPKFMAVQPAPDSMVSMEGTEHQRLRRVVMGAFTRPRVDLMAPSIERLVVQHIDRMVAMGPPGDLIGGLALPLASGVLCSLLGIPSHEDARFRDLVEVLFDITSNTSKESLQRRVELVGFMATLTGRKRESPGDDLLTSMVRLHDQGKLSLSELVTIGLTLLMAGYETTAGQIGLSAHALLSDPAEYERLRGNPELLPLAVDELLRLTPATPVTFARVATEPVRLGTVIVAAGQAVVVSLMHGNRDGKVFTRPQSYAPDRRAVPHLTFGHGAHRCLGATLAKLQLQVALAQLLRRFPALRLAAGPGRPVVWKEGLATRGLSRLLVEW